MNSANEQGLTPQSALIDAAEKYAEKYDGDDRECIRNDVLNAFYAGAKFAAAQKPDAPRSRPVQCVGAVHRDTLPMLSNLQSTDAVKLWPEKKANWNPAEYVLVYTGPSQTVPENVVHKRLAMLVGKRDQGYVMGLLRELGMVHDPRAG